MRGAFVSREHVKTTLAALPGARARRPAAFASCAWSSFACSRAGSCASVASSDLNRSARRQVRLLPSHDRQNCESGQKKGKAHPADNSDRRIAPVERVRRANDDGGPPRRHRTGSPRPSPVVGPCGHVRGTGRRHGSWATCAGPIVRPRGGPHCTGRGQRSGATCTRPIVRANDARPIVEPRIRAGDRCPDGQRCDDDRECHASHRSLRDAHDAPSVMTALCGLREEDRSTRLAGT